MARQKASVQEEIVVSNHKTSGSQLQKNTLNKEKQQSFAVQVEENRSKTNQTAQWLHVQFI